MSTLNVSEQKPVQIVAEFLQHKLQVSLAEFTNAKKRWKLTRDLTVELRVKPERHYEVSVLTILRKGAEIRVLRDTGGSYPTFVPGNVFTLELFDSPIELLPLRCDLQSLVEAVM